MNAERDDGWPSIPTVLRVMIGWFLLGIGLLDLANGADGVTYLVFHGAVTLGGMILLARHRVEPSRAGWLVAALGGTAGFGLGLLPVATWCCSAGLPSGRGYPYPFLRTTGEMHADLRYLGFDLLFWVCAGLAAVVLVRLVEACLPERRTPVDLTGYVGRHAEAHGHVAQHRADENVGGLA
jgi:hypothetical protein